MWGEGSRRSEGRGQRLSSLGAWKAGGGGREGSPRSPRRPEGVRREGEGSWRSQPGSELSAGAWVQGRGGCAPSLKHVSAAEGPGLGAVAELNRDTAGRLAGWEAVGIPIPQKPLLSFARTRRCRIRRSGGHTPSLRGMLTAWALWDRTPPLARGPVHPSADRSEHEVLSACPGPRGGEGEGVHMQVLLRTPTRVSSAEEGWPGRPQLPGRRSSQEPRQRVQAPLSSPSDSEAPSETSLLRVSTKVKVQGSQVPPEGRGAPGLQAYPGTCTSPRLTPGPQGRHRPAEICPSTAGPP